MTEPSKDVVRAIKDLEGTTRELSQELTGQVRGLRRLTIGLIVAGVIVTALSGFTLYQGIRIRQVQRVVVTNGEHIAHLQKVTNDDVLCPLYELFLLSYNPKGVAAQEDPKQYEVSFKTIEAGARTLGCPMQQRRAR